MDEKLITCPIHRSSVNHEWKCILTMGNVKGWNYILNWLSKYPIMHHFRFTPKEQDLLKITICHHQRERRKDIPGVIFVGDNPIKKKDLKLLKLRDRSINRFFRMLANKMLDDDITDAKIIFNAIMAREENVNYDMVSPLDLINALDYDFCSKMISVEKKYIERIKKIMNDIIESSDICNIILQMSYPYFLPTEGFYSNTSVLNLRDGFKIEKCSI